MNELNEDYGTITIKDEILHFTYKSGVKISLDIAQRIVKDRVQFVHNKSYPSLIKDTGVKGIEKDARDYLSSEECSQGLKAAAFLANSEFFRFLVNFFIKVNVISPKMPVKIFTDESKALLWLEQFK